MNEHQKSAKKRRPGKSPTATRNIVWLASYPKSGNTWTRVFLANYLIGGEQPVPINQVHRLGMGDAVARSYELVNGGRYVASDYLGHLRLRERVMRGIVSNGADLNFVKTHNLNGKAFGVSLIDPAYTRSAVYIVRHPMDLAISYARHYGQTPSAACRSISRDDNTTAADPTSVAQYLGNWSEHVRGWTKARRFPVHVMRYEDMTADPHAAFEAMLGFLGFPIDAARLDRAVRFSSFDELKAQEEKSGFIEKSRNAEKFFHSGTSGQWEGVLGADDIAYMHETHGAIMRDFGYL